ncbi:MAG: sodium:proton antiporter [Lachnospiraceae bacterium]|nr:sodium:proton antiporter [Lachnospiraceae bacterium]
MDEFVRVTLIVVLFFLVACMVMALIRAFTGKKPADRLVAVNMITTIVIMMTIILSVLLKESWLADISAIYALVSFVAVIVFSRLYIVSHMKKKAAAEKEKGGAGDGN